jgi:hypothetical protein
MKPWYTSQTIQAAIVSYLLLTYPVITNAFKNKELNEAQTTQVVAGLLALIGTIQGRVKATGPLGERDPASATPNYTSVPIDPPRDSFPDFSQAEILRSATEIIPIADSISPSLPPSTTEEELDSTDSSEGEIDIFEQQDSDGNYYIVPNQKTRIKAINKDSSLLEFSEFGTLEKGQQYYVFSYKKEGINSISVTFETSPDKKYYLYVPHIVLHRPNGAVVDLSEKTPEYVQTKKTPIRLPGFDSVFYLEDPIYPNSHFSWSEALKSGERMPANKQVVLNIIKLAKDLDKFREYLGDKPMKVTSWYRPPAVNRAVGGSSKSAHLEGYAVDIYVPGMNIYELQKKAVTYWKHGGVGLGAKKGFVHIASDGWYRVWDY